MKVILANPRGFCAGVGRAIEIVNKVIEQNGSPVYVKHEVVHNQTVVDELREKGAIFVEEISEIPSGSTVIYSAHGVSKEVQNHSGTKGLDVFDATCPLVSKVHKQTEKYFNKDYKIILIGHKGHPEVVGIQGQISQELILVQNEEEANKLELDIKDKVAYVTQTTLSLDDTKNIITILKRKNPDIEGPELNDICYATQNRQEAVNELANKSDLVLVIGSENSSNSQRLVDVAKDGGCSDAYLIEDYKKIDWVKVKAANSIGITSGASVPDFLVKEVISSIQEKFDTSLVYDTTKKETIEFKVPLALR